MRVGEAREHRLGDRALLLGAGRLLVRVVAQRELVIRLLDLAVARAAPQPEHSVVVLGEGDDDDRSDEEEPAKKKLKRARQASRRSL